MLYCTNAVKKFFSLMLAVVMVLMMGVAIGEATGAAQLSFMPVTAYAAPGDDTTENSGTKTGGGLSDIKIGTDGTVSFGNEGADLGLLQPCRPERSDGERQTYRGNHPVCLLPCVSCVSHFVYREVCFFRR